MELQLLRHATLLVRYDGHTLLVDPMLSDAGALDPVGNAANHERIPMVALPVGDDELAALLREVELVLVTHTHRDHWDVRAAELIPKDTPILCQPGDEATFTGAGFVLVKALAEHMEWHGMEIFRTKGQHGVGDIGERMGKVSGFVLRAGSEPTLYIAGDTIWCMDVTTALTQYEPEVIVVNAGAAQFLTGGPITMDAKQVIALCGAEPDAQVVAVHMETVNHCLLTRADLRRALERAGYAEQVAIPADGETLIY